MEKVDLSTFQLLNSKDTFGQIRQSEQQNGAHHSCHSQLCVKEACLTLSSVRTQKSIVKVNSTG